MVIQSMEEKARLKNYEKQAYSIGYKLISYNNLTFIKLFNLFNVVF